MKFKRLIFVVFVIFGIVTTAFLAWSNTRLKPGPVAFAAINSSFKRERLLFTVNPRGTQQTTSWSTADSRFEDLIAALEANSSKSAGWKFRSGEIGGLKVFGASKSSGFESIEIRERQDGTIAVSVQGEASKADFWAEWVRTRGQVRVHDPMNIGLFRKPGPLPTAASGP